MQQNRYPAERYDDYGRLRARQGVWLALMLSAHAWLLLAFDMSQSGTGVQTLRAVYRTDLLLLFPLTGGLLAFLFVLVYPLRHLYPGVMKGAWLLLFFTVCVEALVSLALLYRNIGEEGQDLWLSLFLLNAAVLTELSPDRYNRDCFLL
ncbi:TPA: DUF2919 family protein [Escherichia coli]|nr:DUF2919 family protein [Escherichia coli]HBC1013142.1 DUF2919 family protein [Escherichia coli]HEL8025974.1 DUF2919 family protein [Escherichia coli]HEL8044717.1 DUF2919 family protein [Escherichia coli]HEL8049488.1 DUF2919 family protein [Escherichia coli]